MNVKEVERQRRIQQKQLELVQKAGPKNPQWRRIFLNLWHEVKQAELKRFTSLAQAKALTNMMEKEEDEVRKLSLKDSIESLRMSADLDEVNLMMVRDQILQHCGREWTVKKVWVEVRELEKVKEEAFRSSENE